MRERVNTGGNKDFVYTGEEEYKDTESTRGFKKELHKWRNKPKEQRGNTHKETIREPIYKQARQKKPSLIVPIILALIIIFLIIIISNGSLHKKLISIRGSLRSDPIEEAPTIGEVEKVEEIKVEVLPLLNEESFERKDEAKQAFEYTINEFRREEDIDELEWSEHSYNLAVFRAKDLYERDYFEHVTPEGLSVSDYLEEFGLDGTVGENIGGMAHYTNEEVSGSVREVIRQWMVSVGHKQNLLNKRYDIGAVGCYKYICTFIGIDGQEVTPRKKEEEGEIEEKDSGEYISVSLKELSSTIRDYVGKKVKTTGKLRQMDPDGMPSSRFFGLVDKDGFYVYAKKSESINQLIYWDKTYTVRGVVIHREEVFNVILLQSEAYYIEADQPLER